MKVFKNIQIYLQHEPTIQSLFSFFAQKKTFQYSFDTQILEKVEQSEGKGNKADL